MFNGFFTISIHNHLTIFLYPKEFNKNEKKDFCFSHQNNS